MIYTSLVKNVAWIQGVPMDDRYATRIYYIAAWGLA